MIDEIENSLHPALIRMLIRELKMLENVFVVTTTHSPVVINEMNIENVIDISRVSFNKLDNIILKKLNMFMHPGRGELLLADNVVLVEGYTEELLFTYYFRKNKKNITIINVSGVMFEPYIEIAYLLKKHIIVVSDNDKALSKDGQESPRYQKLQKICVAKGIKLLEMENTLETDLYKTGILNNYLDLLEKHEEYIVAKKNKKTEIAEKLIENDVDLTDWHIIKELEDEFRNN